MPAELTEEEKKKRRRRLLILLIAGSALLLLILLIVLLATLIPKRGTANLSVNTTTRMTHSTVTLPTRPLTDNPSYSCLPNIVNPKNPLAGCYHIYYTTMNFEEAQKACVAEGEGLAVFDTQEKFELIRSHLILYQQIGKKVCGASWYQSFLTAGHLVKDGDLAAGWEWRPTPGIKIPMTFFMFGTGEPNGNGGSPCMSIGSHITRPDHGAYFWNDEYCVLKQCYICQVPPF